MKVKWRRWQKRNRGT